VRKPFLVCWKRHPPWFTKFEFEKFFSLFYIISTQGSYIQQKLDTNSCFAKLRAISNLFSFFYTPCISSTAIYSDVCTTYHLGVRSTLWIDLTNYSLLPNGLVSMLTYFSMSGADKYYIPMFSWTNVLLAVLRLNNKVIFNPTSTKHKTLAIGWKRIIGKAGHFLRNYN
jgi:hypothetical protein